MGNIKIIIIINFNLVESGNIKGERGNKTGLEIALLLNHSRPK